MFLRSLSKIVMSFISQIYLSVKVKLYNIYLFLKAHALIISIAIGSIVTVAAVIYGGNWYLRHFKVLRDLAREKYLWMSEKDKTDPFTDPIFIRYLKANRIDNPLYNLTIEELFVLYSKNNSNILEVIPFLLPLWGDFDCFTKLALKLYLVRCIEKNERFKALFCETFAVYIRYIIIGRYGVDTNFSFFASSESKLDINICNSYIDNYSPLYSSNYDLNSAIINSHIINPINNLNSILNPKYIFVDLPISANCTITNLPVYMSSLPTQNFKLDILKEIEPIVNSILVDKNGLIIVNIEQKNFYYNFLTKNLSYIIQIICDLFS